VAAPVTHRRPSDFLRLLPADVDTLWHGTHSEAFEVSSEATVEGDRDPAGFRDVRLKSRSVVVDAL
jgi:hypothetical protein